MAAALCLIAGVVCLAGGSGCKGGSSASAVPSPSADQAKQFLTTLSALPAGQRQSYAAQHQDQVQNLTRSGDPNLMNQFTQLMRPAGK